MSLNRDEWHQRFSIQAQWTETLRSHFFDRIEKDSLQSILDIGCGTGALLPDLRSISHASVFGADLNLDYLLLARELCPDCGLVNGDGHRLPYASDSFDLVICHYFFLWVANPQNVLKELQRITRAGGIVAVFAEPDYGGRIDYPPEFIHIKDYQISSLLDNGADPRMGRKLKSLFNASKFIDIECGVYQGSWTKDLSSEEIESEWKVLENDLSGYLSQPEIKTLKKHDLAVRASGSRLVYVPTFFAWGTVPDDGGSVSP